ncbi:membrane protein [Helicobacter cetorum]|uniref:Integral membrane protein n=1 Tax=Helicobacter cetorum (strain ATCC BAA-429 / MIT 00-7128) TaxID=182217 RepID=I0ENU1_HELC0|nr:membrane protein [Helicobacter cetorum]AFI04610.1 hypothetical protein HCW_06760 [Helicobacter cetorum MIT 00-7128]
MRLFHIYATTFFFPLVLLFALSGFLMLFGVRQNTNASIQEWIVEKSIAKSERLEFLLNFLKENHLTLPKKIEPREYRGMLIIGTPLHEVSLENKDSKITIKTIKRGFIGALVMLHKAKVGIIFKVLLGIFCVFLLLFYLSAFLMIATKNAKKMLLSVFLGSVIMALALFFSL